LGRVVVMRAVRAHLHSAVRATQDAQQRLAPERFDLLTVVWAAD
jgi:hypothetical protein